MIIQMMYSIGGSFGNHSGLGEKNVLFKKKNTNGMVKLSACEVCGLTSLGYEWNCDRVHQNLDTPSGMIEAACLMLRLKAQGLCAWGTECSTWVFMSRKQYGRSVSCPLGQPWASCAQAAANANQQVSRMALQSKLVLMNFLTPSPLIIPWLELSYQQANP